MPAQLAAHASRLRARRNLDEMRFVATSVSDGIPQAVVADALGTSQASISRVVARVASNPELIKPSVTEIVSRAVVNEISRAEMVAKLRELRLAYVRPDRRPDSEWAALSRAVRDGLVERVEARDVAADVATRLVVRVAHAMVLEDQEAPNQATTALINETTEKLMASL